MSIAYEKIGRTRQKARTRAALVAATRALLADGVTPTVEQAAAHAGISRTTAYRYFPNQRGLLAAAYPEIEIRSLLDSDAPDDPASRLEIALERLTGFILDHEPELRTQLRLSLDGATDVETLPLRQGRAIGWIEDALAPLKGELPKADLRRVAIAIRAAVGIEPLVWLTDVAGLSRREAVRIMCASGLAILNSALSGRAVAADDDRSSPAIH